jgi:hypothetical protein
MGRDCPPTPNRVNSRMDNVVPKEAIMPIHNWSRVSDGMFHWFHQIWTTRIADWLNNGVPEGYYAIGELYTSGVEDRANGHASNGFGVALLESPPKTRFSWEAETESYLAKKDLIAVRSVDGILVAVIEIVSAGNKSSQARFRKFLTKTIEFLDQGVHVLVIDLFPPTPPTRRGFIKRSGAKNTTANSNSTRTNP